MTWKRILPLFLFVFLGKSVAQNVRSFTMSVMTGWQFECVNTTCLPFATITASSVRACQIPCLAQIQCQALTFHSSTSSCQLLIKISNQNGIMLAQAETITMIVIAGTRIPFG
jgi:hypothetical protein